MNSFELLSALKKANYLESKNSYWWPNAGEFEVVVGAILTQQTKWENVQKSLKTLHEKRLLDLTNLSKASPEYISELINTSGYSNKKAVRIVTLCKNIVDEFGDFETFKKNVSHEWLFSQKGLGLESVDSILCYACKRAVMVVDSYTVRLLASFGYEFEEYRQLQEWFYDGIEYERATLLFNEEMDEVKLWARYHGAIVEYCKENLKKGNFVNKLLV